MASISEDRGAVVVRWREGGRQRAKRFSVNKFGRKGALSMGRAWKLKVESVKATGGVIRTPDQSPYLEEQLPVWLAQKESEVSPRTFRDYVNVCALHVLPQLGHLRLLEIRPRTILEWQKQRVKDGAGVRRVHLAQGVLQQFFSWCVICELVESNPVREIRPPRMVSKPGRALTVEEVERLRTYLLGRGDLESAVIVTTMAYAGTRSYSETFALRREDLIGDSLFIRRAVRTIDGRVEVHDRPKTGDRVIHPPAALLEDLEQWLSTHDRRMVFPSRNGGYWPEHSYTNFGRRVFRPALEACGIDAVRPYDLRHSCGSQRVKAGDSIPEVAAYLGNSVEICARHYLHEQATQRGMRPVPVEEQIRGFRT